MQPCAYTSFQYCCLLFNYDAVMSEQLQWMQCHWFKAKKKKKTETAKYFLSLKYLWSYERTPLYCTGLIQQPFHSVHFKSYFPWLLPLSPFDAYLLWVLIRDGGVAVLAEAGENGQHAASFLSPQWLGLMEGWQLTKRKKWGEMGEVTDEDNRVNNGWI